MANSDYYIKDNADIEGQKLEAAKGLYQSGNYKDALRLYLDMQSASTSYKLYYEIGRCYYKLNDLDNAELYFLRSVNLEAYKNPSYNFLGNIYYKKQNISKAIENWIAAYSHKPDDASVCLNLGSAYFSKEMFFYAVYYYEKYIKYAKNKDSAQYADISNSLEEFYQNGTNFYKNAQQALKMNDIQTAIKALEYAVKNIPMNFDANYLLGKLYYDQKNYNLAHKHLLNAFCIDSKSIDLLQLLAANMLNLNNFSGAYCCFKRILPLVINNQKTYLEITKTIKELESRFQKFNYTQNISNAQKYYDDNNYKLALFEYENCVILNPEMMSQYSKMIENLKYYIDPESRIIKGCIDKGSYLYSIGEYKDSNKYYSKIMTLAQESSYEYKLAKSRIVNV